MMEVDVGGVTTEALAADVRRIVQAVQVALLRWSPPSPTGASKTTLDDFEWGELLRPGSTLHAAWLAQINALGALLQQTQHVGLVLSPLPGTNGSAWWSRPGPEGAQALREVEQGLAVRRLNDVLRAWEPTADTRSDLPSAATLEEFFPGPLNVDVFLLDTTADPATRDGMLVSLREVAAGRPVGLRAAEDSPVGSIVYDFLVKPAAASTASAADRGMR